MLNQLQGHFSTGKYWNHDPVCANNPESVTDTSCYHLIHDTLSTCFTNGTCGCNSYGGGMPDKATDTLDEFLERNLEKRG